MALQMSFTKYGLTAAKSYAVITSITYNKEINGPSASVEGTDTVINVCIYADKDARDNKKEVMEYKSYNFDLDTKKDAKDILTQGYEHLKTLDEYKDASDV